MSKNHLDYSEVIALADALRTVCKATHEGAVYDEGWSDQRLVDESKGRLTIFNVSGLRRELIGDLAKPPKEKDLLSRIQALEAWAKARPVAPFKT